MPSINQLTLLQDNVLQLEKLLKWLKWKRDTSRPIITHIQVPTQFQITTQLKLDLTHKPNL